MKKQKTLATTTPNEWSKYYTWILFFSAFILYINSLSNGYNMDDNLVLMDHPITSKGISAFAEIFTSPYYTDTFGNYYGYRPISQLSFALEYSLFGENTKISHLLNVLIYCTGIFYLYKLLLLIFGKEKNLFIFFSCLLFVIHPIHTEVVNSIKNRDELLSFTFAIVASIKLYQHISDKGFKNLLFSVFFFLLAVLSKKSIYPLILLIPSIIAFTKDIPFKKLFFSTLVVSLPVAIFSSEMMPLRMILLLIAPLASITLIFYILKNIKSSSSFISLKYLWVVITFLIGAILYLHITKNELYYLLLTIPLFIWLAFIDKIKSILIFSTFLMIISFFEDSKWFAIISVITVLTPYFILFFNENKKSNIYLYFSIVFILAGTYLHLSTLLLSLNFICFLWILLKKQFHKIAISYFLLTLSLFIYFGNKGDTFDFVHFIYPFILFLFLIQSNTLINNFNKIQVVLLPHLIFFVFICLTLIDLNLYQDKQVVYSSFQSSNIEVSNQITKVHLPTNGRNIFREGRMLDLVENPLVKPHTSEETIATGLYTLGHYARLLIYPKELSFYYGYSKIDVQNFKSIWVWISLLFYLVLLSLIIYYRNKNWFISIGFSWYILCILLFSNWVELVAGVVGERLAFLASIGFFMGVIGILIEFNFFNTSKNKYLKYSIFTLCILILSLRTWNRNYDWKNTYTLMNSDISHLKNSAQANYLYANSVMREGMTNQLLTPEQKNIFFQTGVNHFKLATSIDSNFINAQYDLARSYMYIRDTANAIKTFEICHRKSPNNQDIVEKLSFLKEKYSKFNLNSK